MNRWNQIIPVLQINTSQVENLSLAKICDGVGGGGGVYAPVCFIEGALPVVPFVIVI